MKYNQFREEVIRKDPDWMSQPHMERTFQYATEPCDTREALNDILSPEFISCNLEEKSLVYKYRVKDWMLNTNVALHGGMTASFCDLTMGILARYFKGSVDCVTVHLAIEYMRGIPSDEEIMVEAKAEKTGRNVFFMSAKVYRQSDGKLVASASAEFM